MRCCKSLHAWFSRSCLIKKKLIKVKWKWKSHLFSMEPQRSSGIIFLQNPKLIPERERGEIKGDYVGEWCVLSLSSACVCVCPGSARVFVVGNVATLFIPEPRGGAAPKLHDSCDWLRGKPDVCPLSCGLGGFIWLCGCIQGMVSHDFCFVILTFF